MDFTTPQIFIIGFIAGVIICFAKYSNNLWLEYFGRISIGIFIIYLLHNVLQKFHLLIPVVK